MDIIVDKDAVLQLCCWWWQLFYAVLSVLGYGNRAVIEQICRSLIDVLLLSFYLLYVGMSLSIQLL